MHQDEGSDFMEKTDTQPKEKSMGLWIIILVVVVWFVLQAWVLPKFGIST